MTAIVGQRRIRAERLASTAKVLSMVAALSSVLWVVSPANAEPPKNHFEVGLTGLLVFDRLELTDGGRRYIEIDTYGGGMVHLGAMFRVGGSSWQLGPLTRFGFAGGDGILALNAEARHPFELTDRAFFSPMLGIGVLFGPGADNDDVVPAADLTIGLGLGFDYMIGERTLFQVALRYTQSLTTADDYLGPLDLTAGLAWEF